MQKGKKYLASLVIGGLTCITVSACYWQSERYFQSKRRWSVFKKQFDDREIREMQLSDIPIKDEDSLFLNEYIIFKVKGKLQKENTYIWRYFETQYGYQVVNSLKDENGNGMIVNMGWIPSKVKKEFETTLEEEQNEEQEYYCMFKRAEVVDYLTKNKGEKIKNLQLQDYDSYLDQQKLAEKYNLKNKDDFANKNAYLELFNLEKEFKDKERFKEYNQQLEEYLNRREKIKQEYIKRREIPEIYHNFPLVSSENNMQSPYLTPAKHAEYATFWGISSAIGIVSLLQILKL
ncbi:hypothetical protein PPERSA_13132 [Pseudocohnilembus persalinus]|uniref:SURF1-like protein n=1 Tax=Pseudocohnilembus persalinus TaxID=266149 RepID=A0A0V0QX36_PSEPJ|nr:hypothetical protein PPERSA_13132 [Pseudocohnilembus persalinus]|eukprot:KRX06653.1 hypothetical protein PPERSA_13132 [Pseudocohnilembus persalinus]